MPTPGWRRPSCQRTGVDGLGDGVPPGEGQEHLVERRPPQGDVLQLDVGGADQVERRDEGVGAVGAGIDTRSEASLSAARFSAGSSGAQRSRDGGDVVDVARDDFAVGAAGALALRESAVPSAMIVPTCR